MLRPFKDWSRADKIAAAALGVALLALPAAWLAVPIISDALTRRPVMIEQPNPHAPEAPKKEWIAAGKKSRTRTTGNHHCESNCEGEPTRTNYTIEFDADRDERFTKPELKCVSGAGCPYSHVNYVRIENSASHAATSFDVWGHPTTWELSVDTERLVEVKK